MDVHKLCNTAHMGAPTNENKLSYTENDRPCMGSNYTTYKHTRKQTQTKLPDY